jgi:cob(I)alamin adenosyltransferase
MTYETAAELVAAALRRARAIECPVSVAVVDGTRELVAFARLPGAPLFTAEVARAKAFTARSLGVPTHETATMTGPGQPLYMLESIGGGVITTIGGGLPVFDGEQLVGAVGVSGGTVEQDRDIAEHAVGVRA